MRLGSGLAVLLPLSLFAGPSAAAGPNCAQLLEKFGFHADCAAPAVKAAPVGAPVLRYPVEPFNRRRFSPAVSRAVEAYRTELVQGAERDKAQYVGGDLGISKGYVWEIVGRLLKGSHLQDRSEIAGKIYVMILPGRTLEASMRGGYLVVPSEMMRAIAAAGSEDELAAIVAHEIGHLALAHAEQAEAAGFPVHPKSSGDIFSLKEGPSPEQQQAKFDLQKRFETEADDVGLNLLANAGYDPFAAADVLETIDRHIWSDSPGMKTYQREYKDGGPDNPHAPKAERMRILRELAQSRGMASVPRTPFRADVKAELARSSQALLDFDRAYCEERAKIYPDQKCGGN